MNWSSVPWFWIWLGGMLGFATSLTGDKDLVRGMKETLDHADRVKSVGAFFFGMALGIVFWPIILVMNLTIRDWAIERIERKIFFVRTAWCAVCGKSAKVLAPKMADSWSDIPTTWYVKSSDVLQTVCSPACAKHFDECPRLDEEQLH